MCTWKKEQGASIRLRDQHLRRRRFAGEDVRPFAARLLERDAADSRLQLRLKLRLAGGVRLEKAADEAAVFFEDRFQLVVGRGRAGAGLGERLGLVEHQRVQLFELATQELGRDAGE